MCDIQSCQSKLLFLIDYRGDDFRQIFTQLGMLCSLFPEAPVLALTATASKEDREVIKTTLNMVDAVEVVVSPDRRNVYYQKVFRSGPDIEAYENI